MFKGKHRDKQEEFLKSIKDIRKDSIGVFPIGVDSVGKSRAYIVKGDKIWHVRDEALTEVKLESQE